MNNLARYTYKLMVYSIDEAFLALADMLGLDPEQLAKTISENKTFAVGHYLFFKMPEGGAFELFCTEDADFSTAARFTRTYRQK